MTGCSRSSSSSFWRAVLLFVFCVVSVPALQQRLCSGKRGCHGRGSGMAYGSVDETDSRRGNDSSGDFAVCKDQVHGLSFDAEPPVHRRNPLLRCDAYRHNTCCNETHVKAIALELQRLAGSGVSPDCRSAAEVLACAPCHGHVGTGLTTAVCQQTCDAWFEACVDDFFLVDRGTTGPPALCQADSLVCSRLGTMVQSGTQLCERYGYRVEAADDADTACFDGTAPQHEAALEALPPPADGWFQKFWSQNGDSQQKSRSRRGVLYLLRRTWRRLRAGKPREVWACLALGVAAAYVVHRLIGWGRVASSQRRPQRRPPVIPKFIPQQQQR